MSTVPGHPKVVPHLDTLTGTNLELPLEEQIYVPAGVKFCRFLLKKVQFSPSGTLAILEGPPFPWGIKMTYLSFEFRGLCCRLFIFLALRSEFQNRSQL